MYRFRFPRLELQHHGRHATRLHELRSWQTLMMRLVEWAIDELILKQMTVVLRTESIVSHSWVDVKPNLDDVKRKRHRPMRQWVSHRCPMVLSGHPPTSSSQTRHGIIYLGYRRSIGGSVSGPFVPPIETTAYESASSRN
nr:hypothetical protein CFP56_38987 [Quercus suber]